MSGAFTISVKDVGVMVGLGMFTGSAANVVWEGLFSSQIPSGVAIPIAFAGFILGGCVAFKSGRSKHARD